MDFLKGFLIIVGGIVLFVFGVFGWMFNDWLHPCDLKPWRICRIIASIISIAMIIGGICIKI